jgi:hypothetical protein
MLTVTLLQIRNEVKLYADMRTGNTSGFLSDPELNDLINSKCQDLYELQILARPELFMVEQTSPINALNPCVSGNRLFFQFPCNFFSMMGLEILWATKIVELIPEIRAADSRRYEYLTWARYTPKGYVFGSSIDGSGEGFWLVPAPPVDGTMLRLRYIPAFPTLVNDTDTFNSVDGWEHLVIYAAAKDILSIQQRDSTQMQALYQEELARIQRMALERNAQESRQVRDVDPERMHYSPFGYEGWVIGPK